MKREDAPCAHVYDDGSGPCGWPRRDHAFFSSAQASEGARHRFVEPVALGRERIEQYVERLVREIVREIADDLMVDLSARAAEIAERRLKR